MGDVFQLFAKEEWGLLPKDFAGIVGKCVLIGLYVAYLLLFHYTLIDSYPHKIFHIHMSTNNTTNTYS